MASKVSSGVAAAVLLICSAPATAAPDTRNWPSYGNSRFNFAACFPPTFHGGGEATNGDGERFRAADGAEVAVYGINLDKSATVDNGLGDDLDEVAGRGARTSYRVKKHNWIVVSGDGPKGEFYIKRYLRAGQMLSFELIYPTRLHAHYAPLVPAMAGCFTFGSEPGY